jgi:putative transposase
MRQSSTALEVVSRQSYNLKETMEDYQRLSHTKWNCKYHVVFIPKYRKKQLYGIVKRELGVVFHRLAEQKGCQIEEGHMMIDHVHMLLKIPPKLAVSSLVGYVKGKSAIHVARHFTGRNRNYAGQRMWARGYFVDTVGRNEEVIRRYIRNQEAEDRRLDQLELPSEYRDEK